MRTKLFVSLILIALSIFAVLGVFNSVVSKRKPSYLHYSQSIQSRVCFAIVRNSPFSLPSGHVVYDGLLNKKKLRSIMGDDDEYLDLTNEFDRKWERDFNENYVTRSGKLIYMKISVEGPNATIFFSFYKSMDAFKQLKSDERTKAETVQLY